jgi:hypothetical protein
MAPSFSLLYDPAGAVERIGAYRRVWYSVSGQRRLDITRIVVLENQEEENR